MDWRSGRQGTLKSSDMPPDVGSLRWCVEVYKRGPAWARVSKRSRPEYERSFRMVLEHKTKAGGDVGAASVKSVSALAVDKLYVRLQQGTKVNKRLRTANLCMTRMARAWDFTQARYPNLFAVPLINPFRSVELQYSHGTTPPASRAEAFALHQALLAIERATFGGCAADLFRVASATRERAGRTFFLDRLPSARAPQQRQDRASQDWRTGLVAVDRSRRARCFQN